MSVQQTIIKGIKEQLFLNNYLVLPGFGGFVLKSSPSHISASGGMLLPPAKTVSFNSQLKQNDGILAIWLQNTLPCSSGEALQHLTEFSEFCSGILAAKRRLSLEGIGFFYLDFENNICFEPQQDANFLSSSFGLTPVSIKELEMEVSSEPKREVEFVDRIISTDTHEQPVKVKRNYRKLISPAILSLVFVSFLVLLTINSKINGDLHSSLFGSNTKAFYQNLNYDALPVLPATKKQLAYVADANGIATLELENSKKLAVKVLDKDVFTGSLNSSAEFEHANQYEIVLGCFTVLENAQRLAKKISRKEVRVNVSGKNAKGMYVVSNGHFASKEEAVAKLQQLQNSFPHAWIKKGD